MPAVARKGFSKISLTRAVALKGFSKISLKGERVPHAKKRGFPPVFRCKKAAGRRTCSSLRRTRLPVGLLTRLGRWGRATSWRGPSGSAGWSRSAPGCGRELRRGGWRIPRAGRCRSGCRAILDSAPSQGPPAGIPSGGAFPLIWPQLDQHASGAGECGGLGFGGIDHVGFVGDIALAGLEAARPGILLAGNPQPVPAFLVLR